MAATDIMVIVLSWLGIVSRPLDVMIVAGFLYALTRKPKMVAAPKAVPAE